MPSVILHTIFGEDVISAIYNVPANGNFWGAFRGAFVLGCQGPDIFYHSQRHKPVALEYGSLLHRRGFGIYAANLLKKGLSSAEINAHSAYSLGCMTHAVLDRACHPYIVYLSGVNYHSFFERIIDTLMLRELRGLDPASWDQERLLAEACENPPPGLKESIAASLAAAFPEKAEKDSKLARRIDNAFIDCARFYGMSSPLKIKESFSGGFGEKPTLTRRALNYMYPENLPSEIDFLNLKHKPWRYPHIPQSGDMPKDDVRSFPEIYSDAVKSAVSSFAPVILYSGGAFPFDEASEKIGNGGLSIQNENGKPCAPNLTAPLPFEQVMEQQRKLRGVE
jgi:hypothetical protein